MFGHATIVVIFIFGIMIGIIFNNFGLIYGQTAGSLKELESQVENETGYRSELENYITSHNMTLIGLGDSLILDPIIFDMQELESLVKNHIDACQQSGNGSVRYETTLTLVGNEITTLLAGVC